MVDSPQKKTTVSLKGRCFISTRPPGKSNELRDLLKQHGAELLEFPMIELSELECDEVCKDILANYCHYTHIAFTSAYGFEFFYQKISKHQHFEKIIATFKIASIGYKTSALIRRKGLKIDFDANAKTGEEFARKLVKYLSGKKAHLIWATGYISPNNLMKKAGAVAQVTRVNLYKNELPDKIDSKLLQKIKQQQYDMIVLTSPSAFKNLFRLLEAKDLKVVCIGRTTASEVERHGVKPLAVADEPSSKGIAEAILKYYRSL
ncbi:MULTISPECIES: uroporphyrinogen-III synthase [unclassified Saccharicrinis]|uniref:uroporphyrinogen-III synthase n=1 Tax=unclassified Saccharicrinis TaxID=2646859 RepID=UPI003D332DD4